MDDGIDGKFFNRELSWLEFNGRVLAEATDPSNLLFDRLKFLGIVSSNLDEFFMVRLASLEDPTLVTQVRQKAYQLMEKQNQYFSEVMVAEFERSGINRVSPQALKEKQLEFVRSFFSKELFPVLTPIALFEDKPMPILVNLSLYMVFGLRPLAASGDAPIQYAVVEIPKNFPRMITLPSEGGYSFILIENVIALFAKELFLGYEIVSQGLLRITRAAEMS